MKEYQDDIRNLKENSHVLQRVTQKHHLLDFDNVETL
jgi:uncharacterized protein YdcH (DUF465 family)